MRKFILTVIMMVSSLSTFAQKDTIFITRVDTVYITKTDTIYLTKEQAAERTMVQMNYNLAKVPYIEAHNYFFRNDAKIPSGPIISDAKTFNSLFGMARTMGENGKPTEIDFDNQFVIAIVLPSTDIDTKIEPNKLTVDNQRMDFKYTIMKGRKMTSMMQPILVLVVDNKYKRNYFQSSATTRHDTSEDGDYPLIMEINPDDYKNQKKTLEELEENQ